MNALRIDMLFRAFEESCEEMGDALLGLVT